eukprot:15438374-Alexandrium_andersonii.AAC.1
MVNGHRQMRAAAQARTNPDPQIEDEASSADQAPDAERAVTEGPGGASGAAGGQEPADQGAHEDESEGHVDQYKGARASGTCGRL